MDICCENEKKNKAQTVVAATRSDSVLLVVVVVVEERIVQNEGPQQVKSESSSLRLEVVDYKLVVWMDGSIDQSINQSMINEWWVR